MKKILLFIIFVGFLVWLYLYLKAPDSNPLYVSGKQEILPITSEKTKPQNNDQEIIDAIKVINDRNEKIKNLLCNEVDIQYSKAVRVRITGRIAMEKPTKFRMGVNSIVGQEIDLGSNDSHFWFWSRRMDPPSLHYAKHEDLTKSMLKTPLNPGWLMSSLNIGSINNDNIQTIKYKEFYGIMFAKKSANGEPVTVLTLISPKEPVVVGHYLYGTNNKMLASSEVKTHQKIGEHIIPKQMLIIWYQEGVSMNWDLKNPQINTTIDAKNWVMPTMKNSIDMGKEK